MKKIEFLKNTKIQQYSSTKDHHNYQTISLFQAYTQIYTGQNPIRFNEEYIEAKWTNVHNIDIINQARSLSKDDRKKLQTHRVPVNSFTFLFGDKRDKDNIIGVNPLIMIDIDKPEYNINDLDKDKVLLYYKSLSGNGYHILVQTDDNLSVGNYKDYYSLIIDELGLRDYYDKNVVRHNISFTVSLDNEVYINELDNQYIFSYDLPIKDNDITVTTNIENYKYYYLPNKIKPILDLNTEHLSTSSRIIFNSKEVEGESVEVEVDDLDDNSVLSDSSNTKSNHKDINSSITVNDLDDNIDDDINDNFFNTDIMSDDFINLNQQSDNISNSISNSDTNLSDNISINKKTHQLYNLKKRKIYVCNGSFYKSDENNTNNKDTDNKVVNKGITPPVGNGSFFENKNNEDTDNKVVNKGITPPVPGDGSFYNIRHNNLNDFDFGDNEYITGEGIKIIEARIKGNIIFEGVRQSILSIYVNNLIILNPNLNINLVRKYIHTINEKRCSPKLDKDEINKMVNYKYKELKEGKLEPVYTNRTTIFNPKSKLDKDDKILIGAKNFGEIRRNRTKQIIYDAIENWSFIDDGKITQIKLQEITKLNIKTIKKYYKEFKEYIRDINKQNSI